MTVSPTAIPAPSSAATMRLPTAASLATPVDTHTFDSAWFTPCCRKHPSNTHAVRSTIRRSAVCVYVCLHVSAACTVVILCCVVCVCVCCVCVCSCIVSSSPVTRMRPVVLARMSMKACRTHNPRRSGPFDDHGCALYLNSQRFGPSFWRIVHVVRVAHRGAGAVDLRAPLGHREVSLDRFGEGLHRIERPAGAHVFKNKSTSQPTQTFKDAL